MAIYYRVMTPSITEPPIKYKGDIWIKPLSPSGYQSYIYIDEWIPLAGGGNYITETNADTHYINVIIQEDVPIGIAQLGWLWIKESILQVYIYIGGEFLPVIG